MLCQRTRRTLAVDGTQGVQPTFRIPSQHTLYGTARSVGQFSDSFMPLTVTLEPNDLHALLNARIRMLKALLGQAAQHVVRKGKGTHPCDSFDWFGSTPS